MATHKSPLLGTNIRGSMAGNTFTRWKGIGVVKEKPSPANPNTLAQQTQRADHAALVLQWQTGGYSAADKTAFNVLAGRSAKPMSGFNKFMSIYRKVFSAGDTFQYFDTLAGAKVSADMNITGNSDTNEAILITVYTETFTFVMSQAGLPVLLVIDEDIALADIPTKGYFKVENDSVGNGGSSGLYKYDMT